MLALAGGIAYLSEPLNPVHPGPLISLKPAQQYYFICEENDGISLNLYETLTSLKYPLRREIGAVRNARDVGRVAKRSIYFAWANARNARPLLKDPFAFFSTRWLVEKLACTAVVVVRHPAAVASSLKRLGWRFDFRQLLEQRLLMEELLSPYAKQVEALSRSPSDVVTHASVLWRIIYETLPRFRGETNDILVVRHEALSSNPVEHFSNLSSALGLPFDERTADRIRTFTDERNPRELAQKRPNSVRLNSRANLANWQHRLTREEVRCVREITEGVVDLFYPTFEAKPSAMSLYPSLPSGGVELRSPRSP
jgi:hypothetical protein